MKVKELKEKLDQFSDNLNIMVAYYNSRSELYQEVPIAGLFRGVNESDRCVFIDAYEEEDI